MLDIKTLENWLWKAACKLRGEIDAPKYRDYIIPLIFLKRLSDTFDDEIKRIAADYDDEGTAVELVEEDHNLVDFYLPKKARWAEIIKQTTNLGEYLTDVVRVIAKDNEKLEGVINIVDFNATTAGQRIVSDERLGAMINVLNEHRLGLNDVEPDIMGRAYEYLLRKFAEGSGQSAGEFFTPKEVSILMSKIINPEEGEETYDPCLGSSGLLIKCHLRFKEKFGDSKKIKPLRFYGQEYLPTNYAIAKMNCFIHKMEADVALGDTMNSPKFLTSSGALKQFDIVLANPMWNQDFPQSTYEKDAFNRFVYGYPPSSSADWGWVQHMFKSLKNNGRMAVVLDTGSLSRGSGNAGSNKERDIRKEFVDNDLIEAVILLPENLFYNTTAPGIILIINKNKKKKGEILLINSSKLFEKGRPKNFVPDDKIELIHNLYSSWKKEKEVSTIIKKEDLVKTDYNLSPSRYISQDDGVTIQSLDEALVLVKEADEELKISQENLKSVMEQLGFDLE